MNPRISVLVPTYNRANLLPDCLASLSAQTLQPMEIIVIDDGSTDATPEVVCGYGDRLRFIRKANGGKCSALNMGLEAVHGDYVWIIDDDDVALPHALEKLVAPMTANPALGMTFGRCIMVKALPDGSLDLPGIEREWPSFPDCDLHLALLEKGCFLGQSGILVRTSVYRQAGPFDTTLIRALDFDMALRISRCCVAARVDAPMFLYRQHNGARGSSQDRFSADERFLKWRAYDKVVLKKVRSETPIQDYVSRVAQPDRLPPLLLRQAYLRRAGTMAHFGLFAEVLEDLRLAFEINCDRPLVAEERKMWDNIYAYFFQEGEEIWKSRYLRQLKRLCNNPAARDLPYLLARQLYWCSRYCLQIRNIKQASRLLLTALQLVGFGGIVGAAWYKVGRRMRSVPDLALGPAKKNVLGG